VLLMYSLAEVAYHIGIATIWVTELSPQHERLVHVHFGTGNEEINDVLIKTAFHFLGSYEIVTLPAIIDWYERCSKEYKQGYPSGDLVWTFLESLKDVAQQKAKGHTTIRIEQIR